MSERNIKKITEHEIKKITDEIMSFVETCTYEEAAAVISAVSSIRMRIAHRFSDKMKAARLRNLEAAESSPNKKTASRANIAKARESIAPESRRANVAAARLSLASARIMMTTRKNTTAITSPSVTRWTLRLATSSSASTIKLKAGWQKSTKGSERVFARRGLQDFSKKHKRNLQCRKKTRKS